MHCENSGSSDGSGASARSDRAKSEVFRDRSASAGGDTRYFSRCLIFWCFWIKPKAQKKNFERRKIFRSILREASRPSIRRLLRGAVFTTFCHRKVAPKVSAGHLRRDRTAVLTERSQKTALLRRKRLHRFDCGGSAKSASGLCTRLLPVVLHARSGRSNRRPI